MVYCKLCKEYVGFEDTICDNRECRYLNKLIKELGLYNIYYILKNNLKK